MAYVYRHVRLDKNEVFYIGIGSDNEGEYKRAFAKEGRNKYWWNIINKTKYEVEIMLDDLTWEEACAKEIEFVKLYGRIDLNEGTLVNMTDGGDGTLGYKHLQKNINKIKNGNIGKKRSKNTKEKIRQSKVGKKLSTEHKEKIKINKIGTKHTIETKIKMTQSHLGKKYSEEFKLICKNNANNLPKIICPICNKVGQKPSMMRWHFDNCKHKKAGNISTPSLY